MSRKIAVKQVEAVIGKTAREAVTAAMVLASVDELGIWKSLVADDKTCLDAMKYLTDRRDGKAKQSMDVTTKTDISQRSDDEIKFFVENGIWPEQIDAASA